MPPKTLQLLIELEQRRLEQAQAAFAQLQQASLQAQHQTRQLQSYRADYLMRSPLMSTLPTDTPHLTRQDDFMQRLADALVAQQAREVELSGHLESAQAELANRFKRVHGLQKLQMLEKQRFEKRQAHRDQIQSDERASHNHFFPHRF